MAYAAVTSLMETLSLNFLQSQPQPRLALEDLEAQIRDGNENLGLLQQILEDMAMKDVEVELDEAASSKGIPRLHGIFNNHPKKKKKLIKSENSWDSIPLTSRLRDVAELKQKMVSLHQNLGFLQHIILQKSEVFVAKDEIKDLEAQIRDVSFQAEERIEMELSAIYLAKDTRLHITASLLRLHQIFIEAEKQTDYLKNELSIRLAKASSQNEIITDDVSLLGRIRRRGLLLVEGSSLHHLVHKNNIVSKIFKNSSKLASRMVGCEEVFKKILDQLTQQSTKGRQVVSIVGMGGIGKTTLAHKVYEHPSITSHFDKRAWVTVSQKHSKEEMLRCLIGGVIEASRAELHKQRTDQLAEHLRKYLKEQRYLIVIDDIWSEEAWDSVQRCFPDDNNGSRILLTSRLKEVAKYTSSGNSIINMPFLDADESWSLYCKVFGKIEFPFKFEKIGRDIVKKCKGLPLAIIVVASLLSKTEENEERWKNVAKSITDGSNDACSRILYLSYNQLPHHLKACFLYFGIFEEDYEIPVKKLVRLWAAEGFLSTAKHVNIEKVAMECLQDLVDRSLVIVSKQRYNGKMVTIRIHDLLRDLCLNEAKRENLLNVIAYEELPWKSHHLFTGFITQIRSGDRLFEESHSLHFAGFFFHSFDHLFSHFKLLRLLDIECVLYSDQYEVLNVFTNFVHLRYFALTVIAPRYDGEAFLHVKLFEHRNMQSFIVRGKSVAWDSYGAFRIWTMPLLRKFCVEKIYSLETGSIVHRNLENVSWLSYEICTKDLFTRIPNLKKLGIEGGYTSSPDCFYNFGHLGQLETLSIRNWNYLRSIPCNGIPWATSFLPNLKKLKFFWTPYLLWSAMKPIGMLPNLEVLELIHACKNSKWEPTEGGFRQLKRLVIESSDLKYWNASDDHFPVLECLELRKCEYLQEIPSGFVDITTLALIQLNDCRASLLASAKWIQDEQLNNYGNCSIVVRSENISLKE